MDVAGKLLEPRQRATRLHHGGSRKFHRRDSNPDLRLLRRSKAPARRPHESGGDRKTVKAGSGVGSTLVLPLSGMFSMDEPPTRFEPAKSWRSNASTRRSPRAVGKLTARRAMTPGEPSGLKERTASTTTRLGN